MHMPFSFVALMFLLLSRSLNPLNYPLTKEPSAYEE